MTAVVKQSDGTFDLAEYAQAFVKDGYRLAGWNTASDFSGIAMLYDAAGEAAYTILPQNVTLYAYWVEGLQEYVTREEWVVALADIIDPIIGEYPFYSFDDNGEADNADVIEAAYARRWFELIPDRDNMVYFNPTGVATREFVAVTATNALVYDVTAMETLDGMMCLMQYIH